MITEIYFGREKIKCLKKILNNKLTMTYVSDDSSINHAQIILDDLILQYNYLKRKLYGYPPALDLKMDSSRLKNTANSPRPTIPSAFLFPESALLSPASINIIMPHTMSPLISMTK